MKVLTAEQAAALVQDGDTLLIGGSGGGHAVPEALIAAIEKRFFDAGHPQQITSVHPVGLGNGATTGAARFAHRGLLKRIVCGAFVDSPPIMKMAVANEIEAYTLPQGALSQLIREIAGGRPGLLTHVGLHTFIDPRVAGGRQSEVAKEDVVELVTFQGREWIFYKPFHIDMALLRGTTSDEDGNITMEREAVFGEMLSMAQATRQRGGLVVAQVQRMAKRGTLQGKAVKIPGILVDVVVVEPDQMQTYLTSYDPAYAGETRIPLNAFREMPLNERKVIARRCALELLPGAVCNIGSGVSTGIPLVAAEEGILEDIVLTNEQGVIGGAPAEGADTGAGRNYAALVDQCYQFDFYDGGGIDLAFLSAAEVDASGNVNISRFGDKIIGVGGFVNISQCAKKVVFSGTFTASKLAVNCERGALQILREGEYRKFVKSVSQVSYNGKFAQERRQQVLFVTERAVFRLADAGLELVEVAPGISVQDEVLALMDFTPSVSPKLKLMDARIFRPERMDVASEMRRLKPWRHPRLDATLEGP